MNRQLFVLTVSIYIFMLTGCVAYSDLYFINRTDNEVPVTIKFINNLDKVFTDGYNLKLVFADKEIEINDKTVEALTQKLTYEIIDTVTINISLHPHSTTLIVGHSGPTFINSFYFHNGVNSKFIKDDEMWSVAEKSGGLFPPYHYSFSISAN